MRRNEVPRKTPNANDTHPVVNFQFENRTYQIDPDRQKVYRRFVEIETSKAFEIFSTWRSQNATA